jgi:BirA family biotin operon repressor/biotin-[acetyl-CoA-carboxylase] ligase
VITEVPETGSTNEDLMVAAAAGAADRSVLRADHQIAGRGRLGRTWEAPVGANLLMSVLFRTVPVHPHSLTRAVALAARDAAVEAGVTALLKWPNDLLVGDRKLAGILAQAGGTSGRTEWVVVGLGMNLRWAPEGATCLAQETSAPVGAPSRFMHTVLDALDGHLARDPREQHRLYESALATLGSAVKVDLADGTTIVGTAVSVDPDGRLGVVEADGSDHVIDTGDVVHLRSR